ncbi:Ig-like domain-containing protein [Paenibacillus sp. CC-CFT747]|nr:Ig-like domain-containing protein [Paenibacillus sp. CC-CFT747]
MKISLVQGETVQAPLTAVYSDGVEERLTTGPAYSSSLAKVVSVDSSGNITAVKPGTATITAVYRDKQTELKVKVFNDHKAKQSEE